MDHKESKIVFGMRIINGASLHICGNFSHRKGLSYGLEILKIHGTKKNGGSTFPGGSKDPLWQEWRHYQNLIQVWP